MSILLSIIPLVAGLVLLVKGADLFVDGSSGLAVKWGIPSLVVGLTVVALGTSAPEAAISITAAARATDTMAIAGVFGSNIVNTLVILGITALVREVPLKRSTLRLDIPFVILVTGILLTLCVHDGSLGRMDAGVLILLLVGYTAYLVRAARRGASGPKDVSGVEEASSNEELAEVNEKNTPGFMRGSARLALMCLIGAVGICFGAHLTVDGATGIAQILGLSERVVGLTVVALGTSLPELVTSLSAARKGQTDIAIGNVVGSSVFNVLFVLGVSGLISPIPFAPELLFDGLVSLASIALLWFVCIRTRTLRRGGGVSLLASYAVYLGALLAS